MKRLALLLFLLPAACVLSPPLDPEESVQGNLFQSEGLPAIQIDPSFEFIGKLDHRDGRGRRKQHVRYYAFMEPGDRRGVGIHISTTTGWYKESRFERIDSQGHGEIVVDGIKFEFKVYNSSPTGWLSKIYTDHGRQVPKHFLCKSYFASSPMRNNLIQVFYFEDIYYAAELDISPQMESSLLEPFNRRADEAVVFIQGAPDIYDRSNDPVSKPAHVNSRQKDANLKNEQGPFDGKWSGSSMRSTTESIKGAKCSQSSEIEIEIDHGRIIGKAQDSQGHSYQIKGQVGSDGNLTAGMCIGGDTVVGFTGKLEKDFGKGTYQTMNKCEGSWEIKKAK